MFLFEMMFRHLNCGHYYSEISTFYTTLDMWMTVESTALMDILIPNHSTRYISNHFYSMPVVRIIKGEVW
ncbi:hypothetical protein DV733_11700 [Halapricum salinum]|uniref:Uncharacterized protein n=1 Tax=Halapricum salinum TaxID=1457250 RepID=A0A4D6HE42_9EURY|nr:hypothetical protein DV733_11700 [Halapricum salinum]